MLKKYLKSAKLVLLVTIMSLLGSTGCGMLTLIGVVSAVDDGDTYQSSAGPTFTMATPKIKSSNIELKDLDPIANTTRQLDSLYFAVTKKKMVDRYFLDSKAKSINDMQDATAKEAAISYVKKRNLEFENNIYDARDDEYKQYVSFIYDEKNGNLILQQEGTRKESFLGKSRWNTEESIYEPTYIDGDWIGFVMKRDPNNKNDSYRILWIDFSTDLSEIETLKCKVEHYSYYSGWVIFPILLEDRSQGWIKYDYTLELIIKPKQK